MTVAEWPNCSIADCPNKAWMAGGSKLCHPHAHGRALTPEDPRVFGYFYDEESDLDSVREEPQR